MLGIDTCSWLKLDLISTSGWTDLVETILREFEVFITHEIAEELRNFLPRREEWIKRVTIRSINREEYQSFVGEIFDPADASLLSFHTENNVIIITEDPAMLAEGVTRQQNIIQLVDLIFLLYRDEMINKRDLQKLIAFFRKKRNITRRKESTLKKKTLLDYS